MVSGSKYPSPFTPLSISSGEAPQKWEGMPTSDHAPLLLPNPRQPVLGAHETGVLMCLHIDLVRSSPQALVAGTRPWKPFLTTMLLTTYL